MDFTIKVERALLVKVTKAKKGNVEKQQELAVFLNRYPASSGYHLKLVLSHETSDGTTLYCLTAERNNTEVDDDVIATLQDLPFLTHTLKQEGKFVDALASITRFYSERVGKVVTDILGHTPLVKLILEY